MHGCVCACVGAYVHLCELVCVCVLTPLPTFVGLCLPPSISAFLMYQPLACLGISTSSVGLPTILAPRHCNLPPSVHVWGLSVHLSLGLSVSLFVCLIYWRRLDRILQDFQRSKFDKWPNGFLSSFEVRFKYYSLIVCLSF